MDALHIFTIGDTVEFINKYSTLNEKFVSEFRNALDFLEQKIVPVKPKVTGVLI